MPGMRRQSSHATGDASLALHELLVGRRRRYVGDHAPVLEARAGAGPNVTAVTVSAGHRPGQARAT